MPVLGFAADESFIHLNDAAQLIHVHLDKGNANAVAHIPSGLVGAETHRPHDLEGRNAFLAGEHRMGDAIQSRRGLLVFSKMVPAMQEKR
jgi:hypothetical protein